MVKNIPLNLNFWHQGRLLGFPLYRPDGDAQTPPPAPPPPSQPLCCLCLLSRLPQISTQTVTLALHHLLQMLALLAHV